MNLAQFPRRQYTAFDTPIERMTRLEQALGLNGLELYIKRDDLLGLSLGGNKTRKLEFLVADALEKGADTLVTCGAIQSNHCRLTLSAAKKEGLNCELLLEERVPDTYNPKASGNNFLYYLLGADNITQFPGGTDLKSEMKKVEERLLSEGKKPYLIPGGGSNEIGATGYVSCAQEMMKQCFDMGLSLDHVVTASGSSGTHAGLVTGLEGTQSGIPVTGISVMRPKEAQESLVYSLVEKTSQHVGIKTPISKDKVVVFDDYIGDGYAVPTQSMINEVKLLAETEGIILDPVYTGKAFAGFVDLIRTGYFDGQKKILFLHTGGSPAIFAYTQLWN